MKPTEFVLALAILVAGFPVLGGPNQVPKQPAQPDKAKIDTLMKQKLEHAQKVLEGIALNNFDKIAASAEELILISHRAEWKALMKTPEYELNSTDFRRHAQTLVKNAKAKNLDGAALGYVELTMSCVRCHKHVRDVRMGRLERPGEERRTE